MRALPVCLLVLTLSGCSLLSRSPVESPSGNARSSGTKNATPSTPRLIQVSIYTEAEELAGKPFRDLGEVSGDSCQVTNQDSPPSIPTARRRMQINASRIDANAVLQHSCEVTSGTPGCYRQALCIGSALKVNAK